MIKKLYFILSYILSIGICGAQDTKIIAKNVLNSTTSIIIKDINQQTLGLGSGFIIEDGLVVTNVHVIEGATSIIVKANNSDDELNSSGYVAIDKNNDLVILKVPNLTGQSLRYSTQQQEIGEVIYVAGNPSGLMGTFSDGLISGIRDFNGRKLIQISAPISPGSSGGPVVNKNSELIGISVGGVKEGQNLNFCIPVEYLIKLKQNISTLTAFNIPKNIQKTNSAYEGIKEGVIIRDIHFQTYGNKRVLESISIFNNLSRPICKVKLLFIVYDSQGMPVDSHEEDFFKYSWSEVDLIKPKLGKRQEFGIGWGYVSMNLTDKMTIRVLDFEIVEK